MTILKNPNRNIRFAITFGEAWNLQTNKNYKTLILFFYRWCFSFKIYRCRIPKSNLTIYKNTKIGYSDEIQS